MWQTALLKSGLRKNMSKANHADIVPFEIPVWDYSFTKAPRDILQFRRSEQELMFQALPHLFAPIEFAESAVFTQSHHRTLLGSDNALLPSSENTKYETKGRPYPIQIKSLKDGHDNSCEMNSKAKGFWEVVLGENIQEKRGDIDPDSENPNGSRADLTESVQERPFECIRCNLRFRKRCNLLNHEKIVRTYLISIEVIFFITLPFVC
jgi:hypothetical protein